ncbi:ribonuclease Z [Cohnella suwonensis]|uniref:Ribonuclease Z n=1 Tax=Cohnella suwonensis TaxID=696072 RepID=A0ABW0LZD0_9BACL
MRIVFLGTSAGRPTKTRNVTSVALLLGRHNRFWLFDAGEGTQHRLLASKLKLNKLERIFITHLHGDHLYGLPGLLTSRSYFEGAGPLRLFGPPGIREYIDCAFKTSEAHLDYELDIVEIEAGTIAEDEGHKVEALELEHRIRCFGYRVTERPVPGQLDLAALARLGVPSGPLFGKLKRGEDISMADGTAVRSAEVVGPPIPGRTVAILGDTTPCANAVMLGKDADVLVHEATFAAGMEEKALAYGHSTVRDAAGIAAEAGAKRLIVTHISSRFDDEAVARMIDEVKDVFPNIEAAEDFYETDVAKN